VLIFQLIWHTSANDKVLRLFTSLCQCFLWSAVKLFFYTPKGSVIFEFFLKLCKFIMFRKATTQNMLHYCLVVSLPRERFHEIKCMMTVHSTHGLFLTCTQCSQLYLHNIQIINIYIMYRQNHYRTPCKSNREPRLTWRASVLLMVANSHPLWSLAW
jgi:hypothetical protein